jgi:pre-mRNA-splicing factor SPF27
LSLQNAESQLEHQNIWMTNLELLQSFGANAWRLNNEHLEAEVKRLTNLLENEKKEIEDLNRLRKEEQVLKLPH